MRHVLYLSDVQPPKSHGYKMLTIRSLSRSLASDIVFTRFSGRNWTTVTDNIFMQVREQSLVQIASNVYDNLQRT